MKMMSELLGNVAAAIVGFFFACFVVLMTIGGYVVNIVCLVQALEAGKWGLAILHGIGVFPAPPLGILLGYLAILGII
jgi:hypothetical protein